ncbi:MAG: PQQ-binding-like beta-propeller repeat protein, partial [Opitutae bacterium]|nr:PQQ-binding-like beta-propeller repeat protein [Opitutae bacterium]
MAENPLVSTGVHGGLVVQIGADEPETVVELSRTGRYIAHILEADPGTVDIVRNVLAREGTYGLASAETLIDPTLLPYTENVVNAVLIQSLGKVSLSEVFRILVPHGALVVSGLNAGFGTKELLSAGFERISKREDGPLVARKPWPANMDSWSHPRHGANGNAVSGDTAVGPPQRVRWVAAAMSEVEGLVTDAGRNFYGGVLARDSFNGLRLWHMDLGKGELNDSQFTLPRLSYSRARPIVSGGVLFAIVNGKLVSLDAATGKPVNEYPGLNAPTDVIQHQDVIIAADSKQVFAFNVKTARELWRHEASE